MNKKSFFLGVLTGIVLTLVVLFVIGLNNQNTGDTDPIQYLEQPVSYESKSVTSFQVFQVLGDAALAHEKSENSSLYLGNTVLILGENYYSNQVLTISNPQRVGTYSYTNNAGMPLTVPVIAGNKK